jgi:hypothetical protein
MEKRVLNLSPWGIKLSILAGAIYFVRDERIVLLMFWFMVMVVYM